MELPELQSRHDVRQVLHQIDSNPRQQYEHQRGEGKFLEQDDFCLFRGTLLSKRHGSYVHGSLTAAVRRVRAELVSSGLRRIRLKAIRRSIKVFRQRQIFLAAFQDIDHSKFPWVREQLAEPVADMNFQVHDRIESAEHGEVGESCTILHIYPSMQLYSILSMSIDIYLYLFYFSYDILCVPWHAPDKTASVLTARGPRLCHLQLSRAVGGRRREAAAVPRSGRHPEVKDSSGNVTDEMPTDIDDSQPFLFAVGDVVDVMRRAWVGINKPGGVGKIIKIWKTSVEEPSGEMLYDVKYTLGGRDKRVEQRYITHVDFRLDRRDTRGRCRYCAEASLCSVYY